MGINNDLNIHKQIFNFGENDFTIITFKGNNYWLAREVCDELDIKNSSDAVNKLKDKTQKLKLDYEECKQIGLTELQGFKLGTKGVVLLTEAGIYKLGFRSDKPNAEDFTDWVSEVVIPQIRNSGKYDSIEENLKKIKDEKEKDLSLGLYSMQQAFKLNPNDFSLSILVNQKTMELNTYKQQKQIDKTQEEVNQLKDSINTIKNDTDLIKKQQVYICNRTNFNERVRILANKYFGRDMQEAYNNLFNKMRLLGSFDVFSHRRHEWEALNAERAKNGKADYKPTTLKQKVNYLDVIEKFNKWELCSEAYKTIESEMVI